jgi:hypothetical protein
VAGEQSDDYRKWESTLSPWLIGAALLSIPAAFLAASKGTKVLGEVLAAVVWLVFVVEIIILLPRSADRAEWLRSHKLEVFVAIATVPLLPRLAEASVLARVIPFVEVFKLIKIAKLAKVTRLLSRKVPRWLLRIAAAASAMLVTGLIGAIVADRKVTSPIDGFGYVADAMADTLRTGPQLAVLIIAAATFGAVEWWAYRMARRTR